MLLLITVRGIVWKLGQWKGSVDEHRRTMEEHCGSVHAQEWAAKVAPGLVSEVEGQQPFQFDQCGRAYAHADALEKMDEERQDRVNACAYHPATSAAPAWGCHH